MDEYLIGAHFFLESSPSAKCSGCQKLQILNSRRNLREREREGTRGHGEKEAITPPSPSTTADCRRVAWSCRASFQSWCRGNIKVAPSSYLAVIVICGDHFCLWPAWDVTTAKKKNPGQWKGDECVPKTLIKTNILWIKSTSKWTQSGSWQLVVCTFDTYSPGFPARGELSKRIWQLLSQLCIDADAKPPRYSRSTDVLV